MAEGRDAPLAVVGKPKRESGAWGDSLQFAVFGALQTISNLADGGLAWWVGTRCAASVISRAEAGRSVGMAFHEVI